MVQNHWHGDEERPHQRNLHRGKKGFSRCYEGEMLELRRQGHFEPQQQNIYIIKTEDQKKYNCTRNNHESVAQFYQVGRDRNLVGKFYLFRIF